MTADEKTSNGWTERKSEIMFRLISMERKIDAWDTGFEEYKDKRNEQLTKFAMDIRNELAELRSEVRDLRTNMNLRSGIWGAAAAMVPVVMSLLFQQFTRKVGTR